MNTKKEVGFLFHLFFFTVSLMHIDLQMKEMRRNNDDFSNTAWSQNQRSS